VRRADGTILSVTGADYSYGVGKDLNEAELRLKSQKTCRQNSGEIARGESRGIVVATQTTRICTSTSGEAQPNFLDLR